MITMSLNFAAVVSIIGLVLTGTWLDGSRLESKQAVRPQPPQENKKTPRSETVPQGAKSPLTALETKLVGTWLGHGPCVGNSIFLSDGTYFRSDYGPGAGAFECGTWKIEWNELPPTLVMMPAPSKGKDVEEPLSVYLLELNDKQLEYRWSKSRTSRIEEHCRGTEMDGVTIRINILNNAVQRYLGNSEMGAGSKLPASLKTLVDSKILSPQSLLDPWGHEFHYDISGKHNKGERPDIWTETPSKKVVGNWSPDEK